MNMCRKCLSLFLLLSLSFFVGCQSKDRCPDSVMSKSRHPRYVDILIYSCVGTPTYLQEPLLRLHGCMKTFQVKTCAASKSVVRGTCDSCPILTSLTSPCGSFHEKGYHEDARFHTWQMKVHPSFRINLTVTEFALELYSLECMYDHVMVYDGEWLQEELFTVRKEALDYVIKHRKHPRNLVGWKICFDLGMLIGDLGLILNHAGQVEVPKHWGPFCGRLPPWSLYSGKLIF